MERALSVESEELGSAAWLWADLKPLCAQSPNLSNEGGWSVRSLSTPDMLQYFLL